MGKKKKEKNKHLVKLGEEIRKIRKEKKISQEALALESGLGRSYMGRVERGESNITILTLVKIAEQLKCNIADFTKDIPTEKEN